MLRECLLGLPSGDGGIVFLVFSSVFPRVGGSILRGSLQISQDQDIASSLVIKVQCIETSPVSSVSLPSNNFRKMGDVSIEILLFYY
jgi:hypothetical protein